MRTVVVVLILIGAAGGGGAQPAAPVAERPSFEVASIRASHGDGPRDRFRVGRGGSFTASNCSLAVIVEYAFQIKRYQIVTAPAWVNADGYDIAAKAGNDEPIGSMPAVVQQLLRDRFGLKAHWETRARTGYELVVSKPGKLRESDAGDCAASDPPCGYLPNTPGHTRGRRLTLANLADALAFFIQAFVVDKTKLSGKYDVDLQWTPTAALMRSSAAEAGVSIFTAVQEQLGLKLVAVRGPVAVLVIDVIEKPSEN